MTLQAKLHDDHLELWDFCEGGGPIVRCYPDGRIELFEVPQYGGFEQEHGNYPTVYAALKEAKSWT
jgi:hypothetical protein